MITLLELNEKLPGSKLYGHYVASCCLWHDDHNPSMMVYEDGFRCLSCGEKGSIKKLLEKLDYIDYTELFRKNQEQKNSDFRNPFSRWLRENTIGSFCREAHYSLKKFPDQGYMLKQRKIDHLIKELQLGYRDGYYIFPIFNALQEIVGVVARAGEAIQKAKGVSYILPNGQDPMLYCPSWERVDQTREIYLVYGIIDAITLHSIGLPVVTGTNGKFENPDLLKSIRKRIITIPDLGEEVSALKLAANLSWRGAVKKLEYPDHTKDPSGILQHYGADALRVALFS